jgi:ribosomal protein S18 acetylase RimI-like enzyme
VTADPLVETIEALAFRAWPAERVLDLDGWRLRYTRGVTNRGNSVWPGPARGTLQLESALARVEAFYGELGLPPRYQLTPVAAPPELDDVLAERGYRSYSPVSIQTSSSERLARIETAAQARVDASLGHEWFEISAHRGRFSDVVDVYRGILARIGERAGFALATIDRQPAAVGLGVCEGGWVGVFGMATLPEFRRRGAAAAVLGALGEWARQREAASLYLQVERDNDAALALYASAGFRERYGYHYRVLDAKAS